MPQLCSSTPNTLTFINPAQNPDSLDDWQKCIDLYVHNDDKKFWIIESDRNVGARKILGSTKRVYGGAFSGFYVNQGDQDAERVVITTLRDKAASCTFQPDNSTKVRSKKLSRLANEVVAKLKILLEREVEIHLSRLVSILMNRDTKTRFNVLTNNCHMFVDRLLRGKDFEYTYPRFPKSVDERSKYKHPRYLISFGDSLEGISTSRAQPYSFVSSFCQKKRDQGDMIEHIASRIHGSGSETGVPAEDKSLSEYVGSWLMLLLEPVGDRFRQSNSLTDLLWELPRDTLSVLQTHLLRPRNKYFNASGKALSSCDWLANRMFVMYQQDAFACVAGALGTALLELYRRDQTSMSKVVIPKSRVYGTVRADERVHVVGSRWFTTYFISDSKNAKVSQLLKGWESDDIFTKLHQALQKNWSQIEAKLVVSSDNKELSTLLSKILGSVMPRRGTFPSVLEATIRYSLPISGTDPYYFLAYMEKVIRNGAVQLLKRKLYGQEDWLIFDLGMGLTVLQQSFKKSKAVRE